MSKLIQDVIIEIANDCRKVESEDTAISMEQIAALNEKFGNTKTLKKMR